MELPLHLKYRVLLLNHRIQRSKQVKKAEPSRREARNKHRNRGYALDEFANLDAETFKKMFRLDRFTFDDLADQLHTHINRLR